MVTGHALMYRLISSQSSFQSTSFITPASLELLNLATYAVSSEFARLTYLSELAVGWLPIHVG